MERETRNGCKALCKDWKARVGEIESHVAILQVQLQKLGAPRVANIKAQKVGRIAHLLFGLDADHVAEAFGEVEPLLLPMLLEIVAIAGFGFGLGHQGTRARSGWQQSLVLAHVPAVANDPGEPVPPKPGHRAPSPTRRVATVERARCDLIELVQRGEPLPSQMVLAKRWGVAPGTCSKWVRKFEAEGIVARHAEGRCVRIVAMG